MRFLNSTIQCIISKSLMSSSRQSTGYCPDPKPILYRPLLVSAGIAGSFLLHTGSAIAHTVDFESKTVYIRVGDSHTKPL